GSAILLGVAACLFRELAFPYLLAMAAFAAHERKYRELAGWAAAMACFACVYAWHLSVASTLRQPGDYISAGWLYFGGWPFVLETAKRNFALLFAPNFAVAAAVCAGVVGLAGFRDMWISRIALVTFGYMTAFLFVG